MSGEKSRNDYRTTNIVLAVVLTSCIVLALLINSNTRDSKREKLVQEQAALAEAIEKVEMREHEVQARFNEAEALKVKYEKSIADSEEIQMKGKLLIKKYEMINKQLIDRLVGNERIEKERLSQIERTKKIKQSLDTLYKQTMETKRIAEQQKADAERVYAIAENRMRIANQRKQAADRSLEQSLNYSRSNSLYSGSLFGSNSHNRRVYYVYPSYRRSSYYRPSVYYQRGVYRYTYR